MMRSQVSPLVYDYTSAADWPRTALGTLLITTAWSVTVLLLLGIGVAQGQSSSDFSLFESVESNNSGASSEPRRRSSRADPDSPASEAKFSLIGTSRIGTKTSVILRDVSGEAVRVALERPPAPIPGYEQYAVVGSDGGGVLIQYPPSVTCVEFVAEGISCDASRNVATLTLTTAKAIMSTLAQTESAQSEPKQEEAGAAPTNPFEALRNRSHNGDLPTARPDRFQPRRIDPADVPPGMRVVSTPFGDRLVQE